MPSYSDVSSNMSATISPTSTTQTGVLSKLPKALQMRLEAEMGQATVRHTLRSGIGTYAASLVSYDGRYQVTLHHWQDCPLDEATERTVVAEYEYADYKKAYGCLARVLAGEYERGLAGYRLEKPASQVYRASHLMTV